MFGCPGRQSLPGGFYRGGIGWQEKLSLAYDSFLFGPGEWANLIRAPTVTTGTIRLVRAAQRALTNMFNQVHRATFR